MSAISFRAGILVPRHSSVFRHARLAQRAFAPNPAASRIRGLLVGTRLQAVAAPSRMTTIEQVEAAHPEFIDSKDFDASFAANFAQYQKATTSLDALTARANELQAFLESSSKLDAEIDDNLLAPPPAPEDSAARKAKRAAKRAQRKATTPVAASAAAATSVASSSQPAAPAAAQAPASAVQDSRQHLEELFLLSTPEPATLTPQRSSVLKPKARVTKPKKAVPATVAAVSAPSAAAAAVPAAAPAIVPSAAPSAQPKQTPAPAAAPQLSILAPPSQEEELDAGGPSFDDLALLEEELRTAMGDVDEELEQDMEEDSSALEASALAVRGPEQTDMTPAGPSLLGLVAGQQDASARNRHSRRAAVYGRASSVAGSSAMGLKAKKERGGADGTSRLMRQTNVGLLGDSELAVTKMTQDYLFLERVRVECTKALGRAPSRSELAAAVNMDVKSFLFRYQAGQRAKAQVMRGNYRLVMSICKKYLGKGAQLQDLISEGIKGLLKGVEKFDPSRGFKFSTYVHWWIRQAISRSLAEQGRTVRLPVHMIEQLSKINSARAELTEELQREPTTEEISARCGLSMKRIQALLKAARQSTSLDTTMSSDDSGQSFKDLVEDHRETPDEQLVTSQLRRDIDGILSELKDREAEVIRLRFGLADGRDWTLEEIGAHLAVTRERVRQIEMKALKKLQAKQEMIAGKLSEYNESIDLLEEKDYAARTSSGTKKT